MVTDIRYAELYVRGVVGVMVVSESPEEIIARMDLSEKEEMLKFPLKGGGNTYARPKDIVMVADTE